MAKLFCTITTEKTDNHQIANRFMKIKVFYGSKDDSKETFTVLIEANPKDTFARPKITTYDTNYDLRSAESYDKMTKEESEELLERTRRDIEREESET
jgi:hypothetical protein